MFKKMFDQKLIYRDSLLYPGEDILGSFKDKDTIEVSKVAMLMITMSMGIPAITNTLPRLKPGAMISPWSWVSNR